MASKLKSWLYSPPSGLSRSQVRLLDRLQTRLLALGAVIVSLLEIMSQYRLAQGLHRFASWAWFSWLSVPILLLIIVSIFWLRRPG